MPDKEKVIRSLETAVKNFERYSGDEYGREYDYARVEVETLEDTLALLKAQEQATVEPKRIELADETKAWLDTMDAVEALGNIADICIDWDGYRTADGLGGLVNEIWAYARYCAKKLKEAQEPITPVLKREGETKYYNDYVCPICDQELTYEQCYCSECGRAVKWE